MEAKAVLLINLNAIVLISFCTDHWILLKLRATDPPHHCEIVKLRQMSRLHCRNATYTLVEQHSNLYRQCNDLTDGYRSNVSRAGQLYGSSCYWFITDIDETWRAMNSDWGIDIMALLCALCSLATNIAAFYYSCHRNPEYVARIMIASIVLFLVPIVISMYIIHSTNTRKSLNEASSMYHAEAGWSLICAILATLLKGIACYLYMAQHRILLERQRSQRRRRQLHNAIMSSCRQDIAMAIRARMTVI